MKGSHPPIVEAVALEAKSSAGWRALSNATFTVNHGECVAIIGPNGCGKSSLLKVLTGEYHLEHGRLLIDGKPTDSLDRQQMAKKIAVVTQHEQVDPRLSVREYVALGRVPHTFCCSPEEHERAIQQALVDIRLTDKAKRYFGSLSGGEKQRASIARAFAQEPTLLLLDEPTNHLDPLARLEILALVKQKRIASIAVLHDLPLVTPFADKIILMSEQTIVISSSPNVVMQNRFITPVFGLRVIPLSHPLIENTIHHFEAESSHHTLSSIGALQ
ncbi:ABC transporter ATP-binding protein [Enterovibrio sp. ZSDZ35]|uniref:ABC transporter ATP-binding protein n=1 Tax=Enterovibrio qingdaonensis TaxID=2899818 RepID=A0ABT5QGU7_9GAMM|nr:ABC transporter ATP-binding protein [Enterovibrio sp. ZSDZ35]MDD1780204.1 ABC transporter ATP-binding protein [Enterovibrio sp. ZSDZ35]